MKQIRLTFKTLWKNTAEWWESVDKTFITVICLMQLTGALIMFSVSPATASRIHAAKYHFFNKHIFFIIVSLTAMIVISALRYDIIIWFSVFTLPLIIFLLLLTLIIGLNIKGATRWINIPIIGAIQPSEFLKPIFLLANSFFLKNLNHHARLKIVLSFIIISVICFLLLNEPDVGTAIIFFTCWSIQFFIANGPLVLIGAIIISSFISLPIIYSVFPHVQQRIKGFFFKSSEIKYQVEKARQAIQEGHFLGKGPGEGNIKYQLPDAHTDYIFAAIAEEWGWIACVMLILTYSAVIAKIFIAACREQNDIKRNALIGIGCLISLQVFVNIGVNINILPSKGMTLPLISYGGSALLSTGIMLGICLSFTRKYKGVPNNFTIMSTLKYARFNR